MNVQTDTVFGHRVSNGLQTRTGVNRPLEFGSQPLASFFGMFGLEMSWARKIPQSRPSIPRRATVALGIRSSSLDHGSRSARIHVCLRIESS